jgi:hypothetical protein
VSLFLTLFTTKKDEKKMKRRVLLLLLPGGDGKKKQKNNLLRVENRKGRAHLTYSLTQHNFCDGSSRVGANTRQSGTKSVREAPKFEAW